VSERRVRATHPLSTYHSTTATSKSGTRPTLYSGLAKLKIRFFEGCSTRINSKTNPLNPSIPVLNLIFTEQEMICPFLNVILVVYFRQNQRSKVAGRSAKGRHSFAEQRNDK
jgi:hypothetical protein